jgi:esterase/lipase superfamily enzyme
MGDSIVFRPSIPRLPHVAAVFAVALLGHAAPTAGAQEEGVAIGGAAQHRVPFLTNRDRTLHSDPRRLFGDERGVLDAGYCDVSERRLEIMTPVAEAVPFRVPEEILRVADVQTAPVDDLLARLAESSGEASPLLYTHGFYIDFEKGCRRAAVLQENARHDGRFLWFSWPSDGSLFNYTHDEADLYWSVLDLSETIIAMERQFGPERVNLAGHSLGGRGMVLAVHDVAAQKPDIRLGDVVLLAPDMDFGVFSRLLPRIRPVVRSITIYIADGDRPLGLSESVHGYPRLGQTGNDVSLLEGVEVIDLSDLQLRSPTGHLYHVYNAEIGADMDQLLNQRLPAAERQGMLQVGPNLWRLQRPD